MDLACWHGLSPPRCLSHAGPTVRVDIYSLASIVAEVGQQCEERGAGGHPKTPKMHWDQLPLCLGQREQEIAVVPKTLR